MSPVISHPRSAAARHQSDELSPITITVDCPAKTNLTLEVGPAHDEWGGRHELDTIYCAIGVYDTVTATAKQPGAGFSLELEGAYLGDLASSRSDMRRNHAVLALFAMAQAAEREPDVALTITKRIPVGAGLGGGSADAAATMLAVNRLWELNWPIERLRTIAAKSEMSLARIDRSKLFYLNFDRSLLDQDEIDMLLAIECCLNRLSGILERIGAGLAPAASSPSLEGCALFDAWHIAKTTNDVPRLLETLSNDNPWGKPGTVACQPGGEWDVRTRFARIVEALNVVTRLDYTYRANVAEGIMLVRFGRSVVDAMPQREYDAQDDAWRELDEDMRAIWAAEHDARVALTLAAACFAAGTCITRCYVQIAAPDREQGERVVATYFFGRAAYLADDRNLTAKFVAGQKILG